MSRDETLKDRFARLKQLHREHNQRGLDLSQVREGLDLARQARTEAQRLHDEVHRARDAERARRAGRKPLDAAAIATAAVAIADAQGVEAVSMRKIAAVLGVGTMSLYHYIKTKEDLLAAMDDIIMGEILLTPRELKGDWKQAMTAIAIHTRDAYRRHPWALTIQTKGGQPGLNGLRHMEQSLAALSSTGLGFEEMFAIIVIVDDFVFGHSLRAIGGDLQTQEAEGSLSKVADYLERHVNAEEFPVLMQLVGDSTLAAFVHRLATSFKPDVWFDAGLEAILEGVARRFNLETAPPA